VSGTLNSISVNYEAWKWLINSALSNGLIVALPGGIDQLGVSRSRLAFNCDRFSADNGRKPRKWRTDNGIGSPIASMPQGVNKLRVRVMRRAWLAFHGSPQLLKDRLGKNPLIQDRARIGIWIIQDRF
jgi:hypothetical protein